MIKNLVESEMNQETIERFLAELTELSRKYGIAVGGCGCCGSPFVCDLEEDELDGAYHYKRGRGNLSDVEWFTLEGQV